MSKIKLPHASGNSMSIGAPATNPSGDLELKLPSTIGSANQVLRNSDTAGTLEFGPVPRPYRNLIINGACAVAQRSTVPVTDDSYRTVDRFSLGYGGIDEHPTQARHALTSSDTGPWEKGFRYSFHVTNGNQTSGAGAGDYMEIYQYIEDQNISQSGWDYTSSSSKLTISFWVKSSVAQKFYGFLYTNQAGAGDCKMYSFEISNGGSNLTADTWTKITHTIPGDSSLTFNNDNTNGLAVGIFPFQGTDMTTSGHSLNTWAAWSSSNKVPDMTSTWWTTNDATFEITGLQLEVGGTATDFEHRSYGDELLRCQRYCCQFPARTATQGTRQSSIGKLQAYSTTALFGHIANFPVEMRTSPTATTVGTIRVTDKNGSNWREGSSNLVANHLNKNSFGTGGWTFDSTHFIAGGCATMDASKDSAANYLEFTAEL